MAYPRALIDSLDRLEDVARELEDIEKERNKLIKMGLVPVHPAGSVSAMYLDRFFFNMGFGLCVILAMLIWKVGVTDYFLPGWIDADSGAWGFTFSFVGGTILYLSYYLPLGIGREEGILKRYEAWLDRMWINSRGRQRLLRGIRNKLLALNEREQAVLRTYERMGGESLFPRERLSSATVMRVWDLIDARDAATIEQALRMVR